MQEQYKGVGCGVGGVGCGVSGKELEEFPTEMRYCADVLMPMALSLRNSLKREDLVETIRNLQFMERVAFTELVRRLPR